MNSVAKTADMQGSWRCASLFFEFCRSLPQLFKCLWRRIIGLLVLGVFFWLYIGTQSLTGIGLWYLDLIALISDPDVYVFKQLLFSILAFKAIVVLGLMVAAYSVGIGIWQHRIDTSKSFHVTLDFSARRLSLTVQHQSKDKKWWWRINRADNGEGNPFTKTPLVFQNVLNLLLDLQKAAGILYVEKHDRPNPKDPKSEEYSFHTHPKYTKLLSTSAGVFFAWSVISFPRKVAIEWWQMFVAGSGTGWDRGGEFALSGIFMMLSLTLISIYRMRRLCSDKMVIRLTFNGSDIQTSSRIAHVKRINRLWYFPFWLFHEERFFVDDAERLEEFCDALASRGKIVRKLFQIKKVK